MVNMTPIDKPRIEELLDGLTMKSLPKSAGVSVQDICAYMQQPTKILDDLVSTNPIAKAELERMRVELRQAYADRAQSHSSKIEVCEAADAVLTNEDHAFSGGMRSYKEGSPTWEVYNDLREAVKSAYRTP